MKTILRTLLVCSLIPASFAGGSEALADRASALAPEFAAEAFIRIAGDSALDRERRIALLEQAFARAAAAEQPYKRRAALAVAAGEAGYWNRVYRQELDATSLRVRAIRALLPLDSRKAAALFSRLEPPKPPRVECDSILVYDVSGVYDLLGEIAPVYGAPAKLLGQYAAAIASPVEVGPMARVLAAAKLENTEFQSAAASFASALGRISGDDRSFTSSHNCARDIDALVEELKRRKLSPLPLIEAYRLYLITHLSSARCADNDQVLGGGTSFGLLTGAETAGQTGDFVGYFNTRLRMDPLLPITELESTPLRLEGTAARTSFCQDDDCKDIAARYRRLVLNDAGVPFPPAGRSTPEWKARLGEYLSAVDRWKPADKTTAAGYYHERCQAYADALSVADGASRETVVRALVAFAAASPLQKTNRLEWFLPINGLIGRMSLDPQGMGKLAVEARGSENPAVAVFAALEEAAPRPPDRILALL
jgi:hypothetical protein